MIVVQLLLISAIVIGCSNGDGTSTNPSSSQFFNRKLLKHIKSYIDVEANPCDDFYQYACGRWAEQHSISDEDEDNMNPYKSAVSKVNYEINTELAQYMDNMGLRNKPEFVLKAHTFYTSCVNIDDTYDLSFFMTWMEKNENMTWALLSPSQKSNYKFNWVNHLSMMRRYDMNGIFIEEGIYERFDNYWTPVIDLDKPLSNGGFTSLTYANLETLDSKLTLPEDATTLVELWQEISEFEERLVNLNDVQDEVGMEYITVKDLPFGWLHKYLGIVLDQTFLNLNMEVQIQNIPYMTALEALLEKYDDEFICRYLEVRFLWHLSSTVKKFSHEDCMGATRGILSLSMNWVYEQQHPELAEEIPRIYEIFDNIVSQIKTTMGSDKSGLITQKFLDSLDKIQLKVGNLPRIDTVKILDAYYERLSLNESDFYGNFLKLSEFYFNATHTGYGNYLTTNLSQLFFIDRYDDGSNYLPYYLHTPNVVIAPLTLMRQPFYHWGYDDVYKYSTLGNQFANIIINGLMQNSDVEPEDLDKIVEITSFYCAYKAFYSLLPEQLRDEKFVKGSQLIFFLNKAQLNCEASDSHNMNAYVSHFPEFSEAFDCKLKNSLEDFVKHTSKYNK